MACPSGSLALRRDRLEGQLVTNQYTRNQPADKRLTMSNWHDLAVLGSPLDQRHDARGHGLHDLFVLLGIPVPVVDPGDTALLMVLNPFMASRPKPSAAMVVPWVRLRSCGVARSAPISCRSPALQRRACQCSRGVPGENEAIAAASQQLVEEHARRRRQPYLMPLAVLRSGPADCRNRLRRASPTSRRQGARASCG